MSLLLDDIKKRHIAELDFHIVEYELVDTTIQATQDTSSADDDQMAHNRERSQRVQKTIKLQDIFTKKRQKPTGPEEDVSRVLLLGSPGTGVFTLRFSYILSLQHREDILEQKTVLWMDNWGMGLRVSSSVPLAHQGTHWKSTSV